MLSLKLNNNRFQSKKTNISLSVRIVKIVWRNSKEFQFTFVWHLGKIPHGDNGNEVYLIFWPCSILTKLADNMCTYNCNPTFRILMTYSYSSGNLLLISSYVIPSQIPAFISSNARHWTWVISSHLLIYKSLRYKYASKLLSSGTTDCAMREWNQRYIILFIL